MKNFRLLVLESISNSYSLTNKRLLTILGYFRRFLATSSSILQND